MLSYIYSINSGYTQAQVSMSARIPHSQHENKMIQLYDYTRGHSHEIGIYTAQDVSDIAWKHYLKRANDIHDTPDQRYLVYLTSDGTHVYKKALNNESFREFLALFPHLHLTGQGHYTFRPSSRHSQQRG